MRKYFVLGSCGRGGLKFDARSSLQIPEPVVNARQHARTHLRGQFGREIKRGLLEVLRVHQVQHALGRELQELLDLLLGVTQVLDPFLENGVGKLVFVGAVVTFGPAIETLLLEDFLRFADEAGLAHLLGHVDAHLHFLLLGQRLVGQQVLHVRVRLQVHGLQVHEHLLQQPEQVFLLVFASQVELYRLLGPALAYLVRVRFESSRSGRLLRRLFSGRFRHGLLV